MIFMITWFLLFGIISLSICIKEFIDQGYMTVENLFCAIFALFFGWIILIPFLLESYKDVKIFGKKKEEK